MKTIVRWPSATSHASLRGQERSGAAVDAGAAETFQTLINFLCTHSQCHNYTRLCGILYGIHEKCMKF